MKNNARRVVLLLLLIIFAASNIAYATKKKNVNNYYSNTNKPIIYGASKITIPINYIESFNILDSRFRVFANDFEDGDLSNKITSTNNININVPGTYEIKYEVIDSDMNKSELTVPVTILNDENANINIERILYTIPSVWNLDQVGVNRSNYADRQILGIYLDSNQSIKGRVLNSNQDITIQYFANDSEVEGSNTTLSNEWTTITNSKNHSSIPLINSNVLSKNNSNINTTYTIELEYDKNIKELNYYHYKDNQDKFMNEWNTNDYAIIDSERLMVVVPLHDKDYMFNYYKNGFDSLDSFLSYYNTVINKYDEYIGLDINPSKITDQNVRTKYLVKANAHGAGAAYYSTNHVAVNSPNVRSFFERNWGGLHEIAHGYQGSFGGANDLDLGEVSNNILGHYIQIDKSIYTDSADWLGSLSSIENEMNNYRLNKKYNELNQKTRLYFLINLLDYFEGPKTYSKLFSWYREQINNGRTMKNQDAYVEGIRDLYNVNIIPYMESWGVTISNDVKDNINSRNLKLYGILKDIVKDNNTLTTIMNTNDINLKYTLIDNELLSNYKSSITINIDIDDINKLIGKTIYIKDGNNTITTSKITSNIITLNNIPLGIYSLQMPVVNEYTNEYKYITVSNHDTYTYKYIKNTNSYNNDITIRLLGIYNTNGYQLVLRDNYTKATIKLGTADMGTGNNAYVKIYDNNNNIISDEKQVDKYFDYNKNEYTIDINEGYIIEIYHPSNNKVKIINNLNSNEINELLPTTSLTRYVVTSYGLRLESMNDDEGSSIIYESNKDYYINIINNYKNKVTDEELNNKNINYIEKNKVLNAYNYLNTNDKKEYTSLINRIKKGGAPIITIKDNIKSTYNIDDNIDLYSLISADDNEDGNITIDKNSTSIISDLTNKEGVYTIKYIVKDSDNNESTKELNIEIINNKKDDEVKEDDTPTPSDNNKEITPDDSDNNNNNNNNNKENDIIIPTEENKEEVINNKNIINQVVEVPSTGKNDIITKTSAISIIVLSFNYLIHLINKKD